MKRVMVAASLVMLGAGLTACGGGAGSSAPTNASKDEFCDAYTSLSIALVETGDDQAALAKAMKDWGKKLGEVGTPEGISDDARKGFEATVNALEEFKESDLEGAAAGTMPEVEVSKSDSENAAAFGTYAASECSAQIQESMEDMVGSAPQ